MTSFMLLVGQLRYQNRLFWRNPRAAFSGFLLPIILLVLINSLNSGNTNGVRSAQFITPGIAVFGVVSLCYSSLATGVVAARDNGVLKRVLGTPLPIGLYFAGRILFFVTVALAVTAVLVGVGDVVFGVQVIGHTMPGAMITLLLGATCFSALGLAAAALIPNVDAAPAILSATYIPLTLISGVFFPAQSGPRWMQQLAGYFPIEHFAVALQKDFMPGTAGPGIEGSHLLNLLIWTAVGLWIAIRHFQFEPGTSRRLLPVRLRPTGQGS